MKEGVEKLIYDYFNCNIFDEAYELSPGIKKNIEDSFQYAYNKHLTKQDLNAEFEGTNISELRERIRSYNNPYPIRLGHLKPLLQKDAFAIENGTIHMVIRNIIANHYHYSEKKSTKLNAVETQNRLLVKLIEVARIKRHNIKHHNYKKKYGQGINQASLFQ